MDHLVLDGELLRIGIFSIPTSHLKVSGPSLLLFEQLLEGLDVIGLQEALLAGLLLLKQGDLELLAQRLVPS